jgi:hypothetical protein
MDTDEQAIRDLVTLWHSATRAGDIDTVLGLMAEGEAARRTGSALSIDRKSAEGSGILVRDANLLS